jgi:hypothetical protein
MRPAPAARITFNCSRDWVAFMIGVDMDDFHYESRRRTPVREVWVRVGKHRNKDAAWDALQEMMATRH